MLADIVCVLDGEGRDVCGGGRVLKSSLLVISFRIQDLLSASASLFHAIRPGGELSDLFEIHAAI